VINVDIFVMIIPLRWFQTLGERRAISDSELKKTRMERERTWKQPD
jgi:hypothetical protein